eukprot:1918725-Amphidinium_carterae.1
MLGTLGSRALNRRVENKYGVRHCFMYLCSTVVSKEGGIVYYPSVVPGRDPNLTLGRSLT